MPELPDITVYLEQIDRVARGEVLQRLDLYNPFVLRSVEPTPAEFDDTRLISTARIGKQVVLGFEGDRFAVIHLMIAGRLRWRPPGKRIAGKLALASWSFPHGTLYLTEAGTTRRAGVHLVQGAGALATFDRGGLDPLTIDAPVFIGRLKSENHTLKRALTDPRLFSGIGNAYSDEILHRARLSPLLLTSRITDEQAGALHRATSDVLTEWTTRLRREASATFPEEVTAFRAEMAVHGRYKLPCPDCGTPVQRIRYASNETNYCPRCQTGGILLADRAMSRLLREDWPRTLGDES
ncbi:MAG TPA: DNA-formamidopyrimidine glycosylase family protein [Gemmatimonadales bacterium]|jgi:formamidopyrimidine-DNA glycosylase